MDFVVQKIYLKNLLLVFPSALLMFSFMFHAIQIHHQHFVSSHESGHTHEGKNETVGFTMLEITMHLSDKKLFLLLALGVLVIHASLSQKRIIVNLLLNAFQKTNTIEKKYRNQLRMHDYAHMYLRKGIIHAKVH